MKYLVFLTHFLDLLWLSGRNLWGSENLSRISVTVMIFSLAVYWDNSDISVSVGIWHPYKYGRYGHFKMAAFYLFFACFHYCREICVYLFRFKNIFIWILHEEFEYDVEFCVILKISEYFYNLLKTHKGGLAVQNKNFSTKLFCFVFAMVSHFVHGL